MSCTCNAICSNDCASNQLCTGHVPTCLNVFSFTWSPVASVTIILASHLRELEAAINAERNDGGRRFNSSEPPYCYTHTPGNVACGTNEWPGYPFGGGTVGNPILASHWNAIKEANNEVVNDSGYGSVVDSTFIADDIIYAGVVRDLQYKINQTREICICDSHCNCDPSDCGCNGECPSDDYYYYYP
jgi:hypothetical protein